MRDVEVLAYPPQKAAFLGGFLPRRSVDAGLMTQLYNLFSAEFGECECLALAMSDIPRHYQYPSRVRFEIAQTDRQSYQAAADFLNLNDVELVFIQHNFDLFDGEAGSYILTLARGLKAPVVTALYNIPETPGPAQREVIAELARISTGLIAFRAGAKALLHRVYGVPEEKATEIDLPGGLENGPDGNFPSESLVWREACQQLMTCFMRARQASWQAAQMGIIPVTGEGQPEMLREEPLPTLKLDHFLRMTDETGMLKASVINLPDYSQGYTTRDNARGLMFSLLLEQVGEGPFIPIEMQASRQLAFLWNAFNPDRGRFRDAMRYNREWVDDAGEEDTHGVALWALGMTLRRSTHPGMTGVARRLFEMALPAAAGFSSLRAWGFSLLGIQEYLAHFSGDRVVMRTGRLLLERLVNAYQENSRPDWPWFEDALAGNSASISQALIASAHWGDKTRAVEIGLKTLDWLSSIQFSPDGMFAPLGDQGYTRRGGPRARFAQRPIEARSMISACLEAYSLTGDERWLRDARSAFQWFLGSNDLGQPLYDPETGGCRDGLLPGRVDPNYSAESLLAFLVAQLEMRLFEQLRQRRTTTGPQLPILRISSPTFLIKDPKE